MICQEPNLSSWENTRNKVRWWEQNRTMACFLPQTDCWGGGGAGQEPGGKRLRHVSRCRRQTLFWPPKGKPMANNNKEEIYSVLRSYCYCFRGHNVVSAKGSKKALIFLRDMWKHLPMR